MSKDNKLKQKIKNKFKEERPQAESIEIKPLLWQDISVSRFLTKRPPDRKYIFNGLISEGNVYGWFATGGIGKSYLLLQLSTSLASGKQFGIFRPSKKFKVLYIGAEDPEDELHRRMYMIVDTMHLFQSKDLIDNLAVYSGVGKIEPLLMLDGRNNPITTPQYDWLRKTIESLKGLEILILDPLSRFYGLEENNNAHGTAWIRALEKLNHDYNLSTWFAHHEPKSASQNKNLSDSTGRGGGAFRDGCRGTISLREMTEADSKKYGVNPREYIELDTSKANYTAKLPSSIYFRHGPEGILEPVNLIYDRIKDLAESLIYELSNTKEPVSKNDLLRKRGKGRDICLALKENTGFNHSKDMPNIIKYALHEGLIYETDADQDNPGAHKYTLKVEQIPIPD